MLDMVETPKGTPMNQQQNVLHKLLKKSQQTAFGKTYEYPQILKSPFPYREFKNRVPIHDYDQMFEKWWSRCLEGEKNVVWKGTVKYFALSSGTSGAPSKYLPVTSDMQQAMRRAAFRIFSGLKNFPISNDLIFKDWLMIGGSASLETHNQSLVGDLSGINSLNPPIWLKKFKKPGIEISKLKSWEARTEAIIEQAPNWDVSIISGIPSWVQLTLEKVIERYELDDIHQIWPNLSLFIGGGVCFDTYRDSFNQILGKPIDYLDTYLASEGFFAYAKSPHDDAMNLILNDGVFYEFIPFDEQNFDSDGKLKPSAKAYTIEEVDVETDYALVISTCSGAWRYLIGDTIKFTDLDSMKIKITGRTKHFLSVCGEHISVDNLNRAISNLNSKFNLGIDEFTVGAKPTGGHFAHEWFISSKVIRDPNQIASLLDKELMALNDDYRAERGAMLGAPEVHLIPNRLFQSWQKIHGKMNGQSKISRVMKGEIFEKWKDFVNRKQSGQHVFLMPETV